MHNPVDEFLEMEKTGGRWGDAFARAGAVGATVVAGIAANEVYGAVKNSISRSRGFKKMMEFNPALAKQDRSKVHALYNTLHNASPDLAKDPLVANSWVKRMMYQDEYVDPKTMSDLTSAQKNITQSRRSPDFAQSMITGGIPEMFGSSGKGGGTPPINISIPNNPSRGSSSGGARRQAGGRRRGGARQAFGG